MKKQLFTSLICSVFFWLHSPAQAVIKQASCSNERIMHQADSLKQALSKNGYIVVKEASMSMESEYEMPVIVPLTQGNWYQFVFIGEISSKLYELRMYDWSERQVAYEKNRQGDVDGNVISISYIPRVTEFHMIKPLQVNKKRKTGLCGYVMLLKRIK